MPAWKKAGNIIVSEPEALKEFMEKDIAYVLVDTRPAGEAEKGFIKSAVSVPMGGLEGAKDGFPSDKSAPIIIYGAQDAFKTVRGWGYPNATVLNGGLEAWQKAGGAVEKGSLNAKISYVPKPRPGEISIEEFKAIAEKGAPDKLILDVRDVDEAMHGMLKGAINIPQSQLKSRLSELPKDKEIITHCVTGMRAETAYSDLKENGYKTRFLNAVIQIDNDGKYEITKK